MYFFHSYVCGNIHCLIKVIKTQHYLGPRHDNVYVCVINKNKKRPRCCQ